jgi:hypothetical protein
MMTPPRLTPRPRARARLVGSLAAALTLATLALAAPAGAAPAVRLATAQGCSASASAVKPAKIVLWCTTGHVYLGHLTWSSWGAKSAQGTGEFFINRCRPTCNADHSRSLSTVSVTALDPRRVGTVKLFLIMQIRYHAVGVTEGVSWQLYAKSGHWGGAHPWPPALGAAH